jgi:major inositol transporter-like SP family MFS transporter
MSSHSPRTAETKLPPLTKGPYSKRLGLVAIIATFGGLLFGYDTGVTNGAEAPMQVDLHLSDIQVGVAVSALVFAAAFGAIIGGRISDWLGRRPTIIILAVVFFCGTLTVVFSPNFAVLVVGRILLGLAVGGASAVVPVFLAEMAPFEIRGSLAGRNELMIVIGQLAAFVVNAIIAAIFGGHDVVWRYMFAVCTLPAIALFFGMLRMPESPRWLIEKGREADALKVLLQIRSKERAVAELADVEKVAEEEKEESSRQLGFKAVLTNKNLFIILLIACGLGIAQQLTGVNAIMYYGQKLLLQSGFSAQMVGWVNIAPGVIAVIGGSIALYLMDRINRRANFLWGLGLTALSHVLIVVSMTLLPQGNPARPWVFLVLIVVMIGSIQLFLNIAVWVYLSEVFPLHMRGIGMGVSVFVLWIADGFVALYVPAIADAIGMGLFLIFAVLNVASFLFVWKFVPETRGRTLEQLEEDVTTGAIYIKN